MTLFWLGLALGVVIAIGLLMLGLCAAAARGDRQLDEIVRREDRESNPDNVVPFRRRDPPGPSGSRRHLR